MDERSFTMKTNEERLNELLAHLDSLDHIHVDEIPQIDLYMDQVTTFMEKHLSELKRYPEDKVLTKTMINNYAKNNLLPSPVKKKYTQEHILLLVFIYYFKNLLSFTDIETVLSYVIEHHFDTDDESSLAEIYTKVFSMEHGQMDRLKEDVKEKFEKAKETFPSGAEGSAEPENAESLQLFGFICELAFDVFLKKQMIERLADELRAENPPKKKK